MADTRTLPKLVADATAPAAAAAPPAAAPPAAAPPAAAPPDAAAAPPAAEAGGAAAPKANRRPHYFQTTIHALAKQVAPNSQIKGDTAELLNVLARALCTKLAAMLQRNAAHGARQKLGTRDFKSLLWARLADCPALRRRCFAAGEDARESAREFEAARRKERETMLEDIADVGREGEETLLPATPVRTQSKAGLVLSIPVVRQFLESQTPRLLAHDFLIAFTAAVETVLRQAIEGARTHAEAVKAVQIAPRHLMLAFVDSELRAFLDALGVTLVVEGATPFIDPRLIPTEEETAAKEKRRRKAAAAARAAAAAAGAPAPAPRRKTRPGSSALRAIRGAQSRALTFSAYQRIGKIVRALLRSPGVSSDVAFCSTARIDGDLIVQMRVLAERLVIDLARKAVKLSLDSGRTTLNGGAIAAVAKFAGYRLAIAKPAPGEGADGDDDEELDNLAAHIERRAGEDEDAGEDADEDDDSDDGADGPGEAGEAAGPRAVPLLPVATAKTLLLAAGSKRNSPSACAAVQALLQCVLQKYLLAGVSAARVRDVKTVSITDVVNGAFALYDEILVVRHPGVWNVPA